MEREEEEEEEDNDEYKERDEEEEEEEKKNTMIVNCNIIDKMTCVRKGRRWRAWQVEVRECGEVW